MIVHRVRGRYDLLPSFVRREASEVNEIRFTLDDAGNRSLQLADRPVKRFFLRPLDDLLTGLGHIMTGDRPVRALVVMLIAVVVTWFVYVPIHELLHAYGCMVTGGTVTELQIKAYYGGALLCRWFPFVVSGSDYAGQLTGFDTKGNDWIYLATDFGPFILTVLIGVPLVRLCTKRRRTVLFGSAFVVALAPFYNVPGDYYEMGSTISTRALTLLHGGGTHPVGWCSPPRFEGLRSDDIFKLIPDILLEPAALGLGGGVGTILFALLLVFLSLIIAILLAFATYALGDLVARPFAGPAPVFPFSQSGPVNSTQQG